MKTWRVFVLFSLISMFGAWTGVSSVRAASFVAPTLTGPVVDEVGLLSANESQKIERLLRAMKERVNVQMNVLIPKSLQGLEIEQYGIQVAEKWKLGQADTDRGLILIVAPEERAMRLEVGYGLEGDIPDAIAKRILDDTMKPFFRESRFGDGILAAVYSVGDRVKLSFDGNERPQSRSRRGSGSGGGGGELLKALFFLGIFATQVAGIRRLLTAATVGGLGYLGALVTGLFAPMLGLVVGGALGLFLGFLFFRGDPIGRSILWSGRSGRGGFGGGGFGGGGWGGGGGGFGGGGASSRW